MEAYGAGCRPLEIERHEFAFFEERIFPRAGVVEIPVRMEIPDKLRPWAYPWRYQMAPRSGQAHRGLALALSVGLPGFGTANNGFDLQLVPEAEGEERSQALPAFESSSETGP